MENRVIYLIRHGKIQQEDDQRRYIGHIDLPLAEEGIKQAQTLHKRFERSDIGAIYCSDLSRSVQTAKIIAGSRKVPVVIRKDLREVSMGDWEGCAFGDIAQRFPEEFKARRQRYRLLSRAWRRKLYRLPPAHGSGPGGYPGIFLRQSRNRRPCRGDSVAVVPYARHADREPVQNRAGLRMLERDSMRQYGLPGQTDER